MPSRTDSHVPGEVGLWVLIFGEMLVFATLFLTYLYYRGKEPRLFAASQKELNQWTGLALTLVLITGSFLVVLAVQAVQRGLRRVARRLLLGAIGCGLAFSVLKILDYREKFRHRITPETNTFYTLYFVLTGIHWFHLILGLVALTVLYRLLRKPEQSDSQMILIEGGACYWHMVDLIWIILFPLVYLIR